VVEKDIPSGFVCSVTGDPAGGFVITNTRIPEPLPVIPLPPTPVDPPPETTEVTVTKTCDDADDRDGLRPEAITVILYADGTPVQTRTVRAEDGWTYTFTGLPRYAGGNEITYTVAEGKVAGYTTVIEGYAITNTHIPEETPEPPEPSDPSNGPQTSSQTNPWDSPQTGDTSYPGLWIVLSAASVIALVICTLRGWRMWR